MKRHLILILLVGAGFISFSQNNYESQWKEVDSLVNKGLPQSALAIVEKIYASSKAENNSPQFLKANIYIVKLQSDYMENFMENNISRINEEIKTSPEPQRQILHSILAELYWRYYQANRYQFLNRTALATPDSSDIKTWDLNILVNTVAKHYMASLDNPELLQKTKLALYDPIIEQEKGSREFRPTLYDFLANRALEFFMNEESGLTLPANTFYIDKNEYLLPTNGFAALSLGTAKNGEFKLQALIILQDLIRFHLVDSNPSALIDADLERIRFVLQNAVMPDRFDLYLQALQYLQMTYINYPISTDASYEIAMEYMRRGALYNPFVSEANQWDLKTAKETCEKAISIFPESDGAKNCSILLNNIVRPALSFTVHNANIPDQPILASLDFKNVKTAYFRVIPMDPAEDRNLKQKQRDEGLIAKYMSIEPVKTGTQELPDAGDFQQHNTQIRVPALPIGYYVILASDNPEFSVDNKMVAYSSFSVTNISFITENQSKEGKLEIFVLDRKKGTPMPGVTAQAYIRDYDYQSRSYQDKPLNSYTSDENGNISIPGSPGSSKTFYLEFKTATDRFFTDNYFYVYPPQQEDKSHDVTYFFTDRSIYRPGQTVYFKGILLKQTGGKTEIQPGVPTEVTFYDVNGKEVSQLLLTTDDFGSFNGVFVAPAGGLTGDMSIRNASGGVYFSVEEYKRPTFKVEIDSLQGNYRLNETVHVTGKAMAYAGNTVDQATVQYRVVRTARFPIWNEWRMWFPSVPETEIASGETKTAADGSFGLNFTAFPDLQVDPKYQPVFNYRISVDVTDITGEVRSTEETVSVGYQALLLDISVPGKVDNQGTEKFRLTATNLNGVPVETSGSLMVYPLEGPTRLLRERSWGRPDVFVMTEKEFLKDFPNDVYSNEDQPDAWKQGKILVNTSFDSKSDSISLGNLKEWKAGNYLLVLQTTDAFGKKVEVKKYFTLFNSGDDIMPVNMPFWYASLKNSGEPGDTAEFMVGTAGKSGRIMCEIENDGKVVRRNWLQIDQEKVRISVPIEEEYRGNFFVNFCIIKENRCYKASEQVSVPYTNKELKITMETFRDKLIPGQAEEWRVKISGIKGDKVAAELLASMYDASLDAFKEHNWSFNLYQYRYQDLSWDDADAFRNSFSQVIRDIPSSPEQPVIQEYDRLNWFGFNYYGGQGRWAVGGAMMMKNMDAGMQGQAESMTKDISEPASKAPEPVAEQPEKEVVEPQDVPVRRNFEETAFFFPSLLTDENGDVILKFTVPESLTAWKLMMLAYTKDLKTGQLEKEAVTQKDLMVMPNPPRFFREGDRIAFSAKVVSMASGTLQGQVTAEFFDGLTMQPIDNLLGNKVIQQSFSIEKGSSQVFTWEITIPQGLEAVVCRVKATSGTMGDGEEIIIPVLPDRMLVTETMPLPVTGNSTKTFTFDKLLESGKSSSLKNYMLTLEFTSNPAWYAVQALPYLAESVNESSDAIFCRYYANSLATFIANSNPKIKQVFDSWKSLTPDAFLSNLEKNPQLKAVLLNETPWVMEARNETEQKQRIAVLFDLNKMANEQRAAFFKLQQLQASNGGWPWFPGMPDNRYITQDIVTGIGKLQHLGVLDFRKDPETAMMVRRAVAYMDDRLRKDYEDLKATDKVDMNANHIGASQVQYLYARSFYKDLLDINPASQEAFNYYLGQAKKYWLKQDKYLQAMISLALFRYGVENVPMDILTSLREHATYDEEMGLYWTTEGGYYWYEAPIERQAMMIEAFDEVASDRGAVEQLKMWLLKQKQTQDWKTSRATADAVYALLLRGTDLLASSQMVEISVGNLAFKPAEIDGVQVQAGTGYFQTSWQGKDIKPDMGEVTITKKDAGIAWGAMYWQYFEQLDKITAAESPLSIEKKLFLEKNSPNGPVLVNITDTTSITTGDKVKVRIIISSDRDMEFVHMKDMRAAAFEPVDVLSGYRYQGGLGYYESIRDASMNFFFDYLRKGTYVFEYTVNVTQKGEFSNGITSIQCLYAPEFAAHTEGSRVVVK